MYQQYVWSVHEYTEYNISIEYLNNWKHVFQLLFELDSISCLWSYETPMRI